MCVGGGGVFAEDQLCGPELLLTAWLLPWEKGSSITSSQGIFGPDAIALVVRTAQPSIPGNGASRLALPGKGRHFLSAAERTLSVRGPVSKDKSQRLSASNGGGEED